MTTYLDNIEKVKKVLGTAGAQVIPEGATAKLAITRPPSNFQVLTADNPDMVRTLASQEIFVTEKLAALGEISENEKAIKTQEFINEFQRPLTQQAAKEHANLVEIMQSAGVLTGELVEDKGKMQTGYGMYTDQVFATDPGQYYVNSKEELVFIAGRFKNEQRWGEERLAIAQARNLGAKVQKLQFGIEDHLVFEGGDIRQMPGRKLFFMGHGHRSDSDTSHAVALTSGYYVIPVKLTNEQFYHIDCCFLPLPNDAAAIYEGDYEYDSENNDYLRDVNGWPVLKYPTVPAEILMKEQNNEELTAEEKSIKARCATMTPEGRALIRAVYPAEKLVLLSHEEALAYATNAAVLESKTDNRFKMFVNGNRNTVITDEAQAILDQTISLSKASINAIFRVTDGQMDILEVPFRTLQYSGGSVRCTVQEVACNWEHLKYRSQHIGHHREKIENSSFIERASTKWPQMFKRAPESASEGANESLAIDTSCRFTA